MKKYSALIASLVIFVILSLCPILSHAQAVNLATKEQTLMRSDIIEERVADENAIKPNSFAILSHKPNYILPLYYTGSPYNSVYQNNTPTGESLKHDEFKYQFSFKVAIWNKVFSLPSRLFLAYTQMSYWQCYDKYAFFRETDFEPEIFLANNINLPLFKGFHWDLFNVGAVHQSNGFGNQLERSWNRIYMAAVFSAENWVLSIKPWYVFHDATYNRQNPNLVTYLGYGEVIFAYKLDNQTFSFQARNVIESAGKRPGLTAAWSFLVLPYIKGYLQGFSGYGQSLIEYNHRTNSVGVGIALSDWV